MSVYCVLTITFEDRRKFKNHCDNGPNSVEVLLKEQEFSHFIWSDSVMYMCQNEIMTLVFCLQSQPFLMMKFRIQIQFHVDFTCLSMEFHSV